jgi:hypothetical protein
MKRKNIKDLSAFPILYPQYVFENRIRKDSVKEKSKSRLDRDYVWAALIFLIGIGLLFSI